MSTTVYDDLSSKSLSDDGALECLLNPWNPETQTLFTSAEEVVAFVATIRDNPNYWTPAISDEERYARKVTDTARAYADETQRRLDMFAIERNYSGIMSAASYATSTIEKYRVEGAHCALLRDLSWEALETIFTAVQAGARELPASYEEILPELPALTWD